MRYLIIALLALFPSIAHAKMTALVCLFTPTKERFNIISRDGGDYIQWGQGSFAAVNSSFEDGYLIIAQYGETGTFRMVWDPKTGRGYGGVVDYNDKELKGDILCAVQ